MELAIPRLVYPSGGVAGTHDYAGVDSNSNLDRYWATPSPKSWKITIKKTGGLDL